MFIHWKYAVIANSRRRGRSMHESTQLTTLQAAIVDAIVKHKLVRFAAMVEWIHATTDLLDDCADTPRRQRKVDRELQKLRSAAVLEYSSAGWSLLPEATIVVEDSALALGA